MVFEFVNLPDPIRSDDPALEAGEPLDLAEPMPMPVAEPAPVEAPLPPSRRGSVREIHPSITSLAQESGMCRVTRPKFVPAEVGVARPRPTAATMPAPARRRTGWFFFGK